MSQLELNQALITFQSKLNAHFQERNSNNVNHGYVQWLEDNIEEVKKLLTQLKKAA